MSEQSSAPVVHSAAWDWWGLGVGVYGAIVSGIALARDGNPGLFVVIAASVLVIVFSWRACWQDAWAWFRRKRR